MTVVQTLALSPMSTSVTSSRTPLLGPPTRCGSQAPPPHVHLLPLTSHFGAGIALERLSAWAGPYQRGSTHQTLHTAHLAGGKPSILTPPALELCTTSTSALSPTSTSLSPLDFSSLGASNCQGVQVMFSKKFSHHVHSHKSSGRLEMFLQFNNHSAGGWGRATGDRSVPLWQTTPNLGFSYQEMHAPSPGSQFSSKSPPFAVMLLSWLTQALALSWALFSGLCVSNCPVSIQELI